MHDDNHSYAWGYIWAVTYVIDGSDEGISVIKLFRTPDAAERFLEQHHGRPDRYYKVTRLEVWVD